MFFPFKLFATHHAKVFGVAMYGHLQILISNTCISCRALYQMVLSSVLCDKRLVALLHHTRKRGCASLKHHLEEHVVGLKQVQVEEMGVGEDALALGTHMKV